MTPACDRCQKEILVSEGFNMHYENMDDWLADNGLIISVEGYYDGFLDDYDQPATKLRFCHDCSLDFWRWIPKLRDAKERGLHSLRPGQDFCCEYSWKFDEATNSVLYADGSSRVIHE